MCNILCVVVAEGGAWPKVISTYAHHCGMRVCIHMCNEMAIYMHPSAYANASIMEERPVPNAKETGVCIYVVLVCTM